MFLEHGGNRFLGAGGFCIRLQQWRDLCPRSLFPLVEGRRQERWVVGETLHQEQLCSQGKDRHPARLWLLEVLEHLRMNTPLVVQWRVQRVEYKHGYRVTLLDPGDIGEDIGRQIGQACLQRLRSGVLLEKVDGLRMSVLYNLKVLLVQTSERAVIFAGDHDVENDNPRIGFEDAALVLVCRGGLAAERRGKRKGQPA